MKLTARSWLVLACALLSGCGDDPSIDLSTRTVRDPIDADDASNRVARCDQAPDGTPCGLDMHCVFNVCSENVCGDGVKYGAEACDDGNDRDHDRCDSRCQMEIPPGCGNGKLEPGEQCDDPEAVAAGRCTDMCTMPTCGDEIVSPGEDCDDGNASDGDRCSSRCKVIPERCGNGDKDSSEACDDGNTVDGDGCQSNCTLTKDAGVAAAKDAGMGTVSMDAATVKMDAATVGMDASTLDAGRIDSGTADAGAARPDSGATKPDAGRLPPFGTAHAIPACKACREENCASFDGLVATLELCFENADPVYIQQCVDVVECAYRKKCGYNAKHLKQCFCGTFNTAQCQIAGNQDGPCVSEVYAAARTTTLGLVVERLGAIEFPLGAAYYLHQCDAKLCPDCVP